jgi:PhnB protein
MSLTKGDIMRVEPYLNFEGRCDEAIEFYKKAAGAEVQMLMRFDQAPPGVCPGGQPAEIGKKVMHASLRIGDSRVFVSDGRCSGNAKFDGISLSLSAKDDAQAQRVFNALSEGGQVSMPLGKTFFSSSFGMLQDRFGVVWMVIVAS